MGNVVMDQTPTMMLSRSQDDPHEGHMSRTHEKAHEENDFVGLGTNSVESEREERGTTVRESDSHGMAVRIKRDNTEQYEE